MIERENGIPYYRQLMDLVQRQIDNGLLQEGQQISPETEMSETFQVNRHTVRQAISELCRLGVLYKIRGRGTFVAKAPLDCIEYQLSAKNRFSENITKMGGIPDTKILHPVEMPAPENVRELLKLNFDDTVYCCYIQRFVNNRPFLVGQSFLPAKYFPNALEYLRTIQSMSYFYEKYDITYKRVKSTIRATFPSQEEAMLLSIPSNMPVIKVENLLKSQDNILIDYGVSCYRGDMAKLSLTW
jgi:GntR family phosphonate transport system transcriptional regulator